MKHFKDTTTNELYAYEADGSQDAFIKEGLIEITNEEADAIRLAAQQAVLNSLTYAEKRAAAYPSIQDQLDLLYHGGMDAWRAAITAVKEEFPK